MDCCNYVQPYATAGHHYYQHQHQQQPQHNPYAQQHQHQPHMQMQMHQQQQQQQLPAQQYCYEAPNAYAPAYNAAIEARYNCRLPPAYPTDYVYNPKEARLRKAMREQNRSQQPVNGPARGTTSSSGQHQQVSPLPGGGSIANRMIGPWFPLGASSSSSPSTAQPVAAAAAAPTTQPKPILSPRVMAAHQRTLDKTKDVIRKQLQDCGPFPGMPAASSAYPNAAAAQENQPSEYNGAGEFEGQQQKWHPYQNGVNAYHSRGALMSKMNSLHRGMQSSAPHPGPAWGQFCNVPFPPSQSVMMQQQQQQRSNRHMVFLQEQQQQQQSQQSHCGYPSAEMQLQSYEAKMQDDLARRLHSSYSQEEQQQQQQVKSPLMELQLSQLPQEDNAKTEEAPRWPTPRPASSGSSCTPDGLLESSESTTTAQASKQPLPGFQQAFGSTEIGRFSRSELFASLVEAVNVSSAKSEEQQQFELGRSSTPDYNGYNAGSAAHTWHSPYAIGSEI